jgi:biopolymer transport protein ExbD
MRPTIRTTLLALLTVILIRTAVKRVPHSSVGFYVELPLRVTHSECGERRDIVVQISNTNSLSINAEKVSPENLGGRLRELYQVRAERVLFVAANPDVSFQEVVRIIDIARGAVTNLYVSLLTPAAQNEPCFFIKVPMVAPDSPGLPP